ncbi:MAG: carbohydrate binding family 9 domain-containing protein [Ignavibacteriales bacterium]|nr:carbohydrate binding family 9 domain-containing protein [Ignavibacteriales bacterium]
MKNVLLLLFLTSIVDAAQNEDKKLTLKKILQPITIDGNIDEAWSLADSATDFFQTQPYYGKEPTKRTVGKVLTTEEAIYGLIVCYDDKSNIQTNTGKLDDFGGDVVSLMIDTFGDKRTAYKFAVTASGVRADCRLLDDARNRDYSWDGVWFSAAKVYDWGFVVEMEIPYRSIQYDENLESWGIDFDRWIPWAKEDLYWCTYEESEGQRISKFGTLKFDEFRPSIHGMNLEIYPVAISKATYLRESVYKGEPNAGIDIFYNPSQSLTFQLTANPDFAQIEADPFSFNISRYETYFEERRPFFTQGNEVFMPSGRERNTGFYRPLELFYSRRIGKKLEDGSEVPLEVGTKAFGRIQDWEYGGFLAMTGERDFFVDGVKGHEPRAYFGSVRLKRQVLDNSSVGFLFVGKQTATDNNGVLDIDGAFRSSDWQLSYQLARSFKNSDGDYAGSTGFVMFSEDLFAGVRGRYVGSNFDINEVGFVPWRGTAELTAIGGPRWYYKEGYIKAILLYIGGILNHEKVDAFTDRLGVLGFNMQLRDNWGYEITFLGGRSKDLDKEFGSYEIDVSSWFNPSPKWNGNIYGGYQKTYNFSRNYLAFYSWLGSYFSWHALDMMDLGTSFNAFVEGNPDNKIEDITYNARPFVSLTPVNDLNMRVYFDNVYVRSTKRIERIIAGLLFSYSFLPKSWIYLAVNEIQDRRLEHDTFGNVLLERMHTTARAGVFKLKYLYYF